MSVSPPPLKRRRLSSSSPALSFPIQHISKISNTNEIPPRPSPSTFRVVSYNVNGITHLLPPAPTAQKSITSFFPQSPTQKIRSRRDTSTNVSHGSAQNSQETEGGNDKSGKAENIKEYGYLRDRLRKWQWPDVVCLQEVHISSTDTRTQNRVTEAANHIGDRDQQAYNGREEKKDAGPGYEAFFCLPTDRTNAKGRGGKGQVHGVCTLVRKRLGIGGIVMAEGAEERGVLGREMIQGDDRLGKKQLNEYEQEHSIWTIDTLPWDREGRILVLTIPFSSPRRIASTSSTPSLGLKLLNLYLPNGTSLPYYPPPSSPSFSRSSSTPTTRHNYKRSFHTHLAHTVHTYEQKGWMVLLAGDMNISRTVLDSFPALRMGAEHVVNRADFERKFFSFSSKKEKERGGLGLVDIFRHLHPEAKKYSYRPRKERRGFGGGGDRVDMIIGSRGFVDDSTLTSSSSSCASPGKRLNQSSGEMNQLEGREQKESSGSQDHGHGAGRIQAVDITDDGTDAPPHGIPGITENHGARGRLGTILVEADICDCEEERAASDHVPIWVGLDLQDAMNPIL